MSRIRKAVIPAAGFGTRFLPITKSIPKEMLAIVDKPVIHYIVEEAIASGIEEIIIVTSRSKRAIEDYFDRNVELEALLEKKNKIRVIEQLEHMANMADITFVRQKEMLGLGHAIWSARKAVGNEPFAVLLGDIVFRGKEPYLKQLLDHYYRLEAPVIAVHPVNWEDTEKYGIVDGAEVQEGVYELIDIVEKPINNPPSNLAVVGRYVLPGDIFDLLEHTAPGVGGEIQLTDALQTMSGRQSCYACICEGSMYDVGDKLGYLIANVDYGKAHEELGSALRKYLKETGNEGDHG